MESGIELYDHTVTITVPLGTATQINRDITDIPKDYDRVFGILVYPHQASFTLRLGISQGSKTVQQLTHPDDWKSSSAVAHEQRPKKVSFRADIKTTLSIEPLAALAAAETFDIVFRCTKSR